MTGEQIDDRAKRLREVGQELRAARKAAGLKQEEVAQLIGVSPITVSRWERGAQEMSIGDFRKYMNAIGVADYRWEFYDRNDPKSPGDQSLAEDIRRKRQREAEFTLAQHARLATLEEFARRVRMLLEELGLPPMEPEPEGEAVPAKPQATYVEEGGEVRETPRRRRAKGA